VVWEAFRNDLGINFDGQQHLLLSVVVVVVVFCWLSWLLPCCYGDHVVVMAIICSSLMTLLFSINVLLFFNFRLAYLFIV